MLADIDKFSPDRSSPIPNTHDVVDPATVMAKGTNSVNYNTAASDTGSQLAALNGQFTIISASDITTNIVSVSGPGAGALNSNVVNGYTFAHGLNFVPTVIAYFGSSTTIFGGMPSLNYNALNSAQGLWFTVQASADSTNVYIDFNVMQFGRSGLTTLSPLQVRVYLMQQRAN